MKKIKGQTRQGDVLMLPTTKAVGKRKRVKNENGRVILAHGEVTGHAHAIDGASASLYLDDATVAAPDVMPLLALAGGLPGDRLLVAKEVTALKHEEHSQHALRKGEKRIVRIQRQYQWGRSQRVAD